MQDCWMSVLKKQMKLVNSIRLNIHISNKKYNFKSLPKDPEANVLTPRNILYFHVLDIS